MSIQKLANLGRASTYFCRKDVMTTSQEKLRVVCELPDFTFLPFSVVPSADLAKFSFMTFANACLSFVDNGSSLCHTPWGSSMSGKAACTVSHTATPSGVFAKPPEQVPSTICFASLCSPFSCAIALTASHRMRPHSSRNHGFSRASLKSCSKTFAQHSSAFGCTRIEDWIMAL